MSNFSRSSIYSEVAQFNTHAEYVSPPDGLTLKTQEERVLWRQLVTSRAQTDWRDIDLIQIHKVMKIELRLRKLLEQLEVEGELVEDRWGQPKVNPLVTAIKVVQGFQQAIVTNMGLVSNFVDATDRVDTMMMNRQGSRAKSNEASPLLAN